MNRTFGEGALQLAGLSARTLGWRPDEFWHATPAELAAILMPDAGDGAPLARSEFEKLMELDRNG
ncbi:phage tail assembly chaperone [Altererythrobacter sp. ZODW24]|uniref:phage tail assembly chaperone n=1 Tax=Altererythrobacter sp. ZODW24 TaxID=2185142 RepID=UPI000DF76636|nr:phage tail assembly chaperone [Altererythrobacter sp. ZODW24]